MRAIGCIRSLNSVQALPSPRAAPSRVLGASASCTRNLSFTTQSTRTPGDRSSASASRSNRQLTHAPRLSFHPERLVRHLHSTHLLLDVPTWPPPSVPQPPVGPSDPQPPKRYRRSPSPRNRADGEDDDENAGAGGVEQERLLKKWGENPFVQAGVTTVVGLIAVFVGGVGYLQWYKAHVLNKMEDAFAPGYDPALEIGSMRNRRTVETAEGVQKEEGHILRREQALVDRIVSGNEVGSYWLVIGSKGTGKGTMILDAMRTIAAEGSAFCEAHPDLEVFRLRLGKALNYEFNEDWQGSLFSRRDPREGGPQLDIERAMNKLEKVALRYTRKHGRPLVLAFNNVHLFPNNDEGHALLRQLQQRAEAWAEAGICNMIFSTDDFCMAGRVKLELVTMIAESAQFFPGCFDAMKKNASRMRVLSVYDLPRAEAMKSLRYLRRSHFDAVNRPPIEDAEETLEQVLDLLGGRTSFLMRVSRADDMLHEARQLVAQEKAWLLSKIGLIPEHDDDVMDEQNCSWLLLREFVRQYEKAKEENGDGQDVEFHVPYYRARQVMTRTDFLDPLDHANIISIDVNHNVRPDSMVILQAAKEVVEEEGFDDMLDATRDRVDEIEGLHRQSELTIKEPFKVRKTGGGIWAFFGGTQTMEIEGLGASFVPKQDDQD